MKKNCSAFLLIILLQLLKVVLTFSSKSHPITTLINAKWGLTPLHIEVAEFVAEENPTLYWDYLEALNDLKPEISIIDSDEEQYQKAIQIAKNLLPQGQINLLKLSLSLKSHTALIEAHSQIAQEVLLKEKCEEEAFVQIGEEIICDVNTFEHVLEEKTGQKIQIELFSFDHIYPGSQNNSLTIVLYGELGKTSLKYYHEKLKNMIENKNLRYVLRNYIKNHTKKKVRLSGYGVEMHLKSTEYKSQDDSPRQTTQKNQEENQIVQMEVEGLQFEVLKERFPHLSHSLDTFRLDLLEKHDKIEPLKAWEFQDLGLQASEKIASIQGEEALQILQLTAQNFPLQAKHLLHIPVTEDFRSEMKHNIELFGRNLNLQPPDAALFLNGLFFDAETLDIYTLLETMRSESRVLDGLHQLRFSGKSSEPLLALDLSTTSHEFAIDIRDSAIIWINDIENDAQYKRWPSSVLDLLRPTFPGMMRNVRKNIFHLVVILDPLKSESRDLIKLAESFVSHAAPVRLGVVLANSNENYSDNLYQSIMCAFNYITQKKSALEGLGYLLKVLDDVNLKNDISKHQIDSQFKRIFPKLSTEQLNVILGEDSDFDYGRQLTKEFIDRLASKKLPQALINGVPLPASSLNINDFEEAVLTEIMQITPTIQKAVYRGELDDSMIVIDYFMSQPHVMPRLNERILSSKDQMYLEMSGNPYNDLENVHALSQLSNNEMTATLMANLKYFVTKSGTEKYLSNDKLYFHSLWIVGDLNSEVSSTMLKNALKFMKSTRGVRVTFIPNADNQSPFKTDNINNLVWAILNTLESDEATNIVLKLLELENISSFVPTDNVKGFLRTTEVHLKMMRVYCQRVLSLKSSETILIVNGRIIGPLGASEAFDIEDFNLLERFNNFLYVDKIKSALKEVDKQEIVQLTSDIFLKLNALLIPRQSLKTRYSLPVGLKEDRTVVKLNPKNQNLPSFNIVAVVDPTSRGAQKLSSILILLRNIINCSLKLFLCAVEKHSDMPIKNFYRYVVEPELQFNDGKLVDGPVAKFIGLPAESLLTQNLNVPENWLVEVVRSVYDLDNIKLADINGPVHSVYELEYLLLEGHCFDSTTGAPPRGLQFILNTKDNRKSVDTLVMANLGYFQLKANPGTWNLQLRHGKSSEIYEISQVDGLNIRHTLNYTRVVISSLKSLVLKVRVNKKVGMHNMDLLSDTEDTANSGIWNSIASSLTGSDSSVEIDTINIFSVASGHLYERLLRIMMLSLLKHTKSSVKFWFLKNYLSPQFIDFLPHMAKYYKFEYEFVQYKWPRWLHQQTEKQRIIWGYKILFLDVLFPLDVKKIIFVDADQIVRADIKELYNYDLDGAPYGYVPFCDSRKEMDGFRFWKLGYWKNHLQGRPYHISALYVVDLKRFRRIAAGDRLRGQYQALSQDPNSLSNLDQDLPNNMIHQVMIKSLPQEWLWCETWCSTESLKTAKTIDLCNNPQTKEAKLTAAHRIVPEWKDYDLEIKKLIADVEIHEEVQHSPGKYYE
uniref:CSON010503 protein n=1 Tax=Culicoides sonorensis TaxID=179676 RepID=A0A336KG93_CULSO